MVRIGTETVRTGTGTGGSGSAQNRVDSSPVSVCLSRFTNRGQSYQCWIDIIHNRMWFRRVSKCNPNMWLSETNGFPSTKSPNPIVFLLLADKKDVNRPVSRRPWREEAALLPPWPPPLSQPLPPHLR